MIYRFRRFVYVPVTTEVYIEAQSDEQAIKIVNELDPDTLTWRECPITPYRTTYELVKDDKNS